MSVPDLQFRKSSLCESSACVEVAFDRGDVHVRDSKHPDRAPFVFDRQEWTAFVASVKAGEFDAE